MVPGWDKSSCREGEVNLSFRIVCPECGHTISDPWIVPRKRIVTHMCPVCKTKVLSKKGKIVSGCNDG